MEYDPYLG